MIHNQTAFTLINPQNGNLAFRLFSFEDDDSFRQLQRYSYYYIIWITNGSGTLKTAFKETEFKAGTMFTFSLYQPFTITGPVKGLVINFHPEFFCIYKHHKEVSSNGVLFNNIYDAPLISVTALAAATFNMLYTQMRQGMESEGLAQYELLLSYLKIFLITAARLKIEQYPQQHAIDLKEPFILQTLRDAIEENYKRKHSASAYADMLNISPKALSRLAKVHFNKTLTDLIAERIIIEAKRELYLTNKPVKEIAFELGYGDEYYFSRFFKANASVSPQHYRDTVGFGKG